MKEKKDNKGAYERYIKDAKILLNLGAGKIVPTELIEKEDPYLLVNVDKNYFSETSINRIDDFCLYVQNCGMPLNENRQQNLYSKSDVFEFLQRNRIFFDEIYLCRFLEHIPRTNIIYFIYLLSISIKKGGSVKIIVPNYKTLAKRILEEQVTSIGFDKEDIITTTELLNEPGDPHASIWTSQRAKHFFEYESRFEVKINSENFLFDGRDIYLNFEAIRS